MENSTNLIVISPHLDDGVFSCGEALALCNGATVITVFAGVPEPQSEATSWDAACGFSAGDNVICARREEDRRALKMLDAIPIWLDFLDSQYASSPSVADVAYELSRSIGAAWKQNAKNQVCFPLGLFHSDHHLVRNAALVTMEDFPDANWVFYEDMPYRNIDNLRDETIASLQSSGMRVMSYCFPVHAGLRKLKKKAVLCYQSQLKGLLACNREGYLSLFGEEHYHLLRSPIHARVQAPASLSRAM